MESNAVCLVFCYFFFRSKKSSVFLLLFYYTFFFYKCVCVALFVVCILIEWRCVLRASCIYDWNEWMNVWGNQHAISLTFLAEQRHFFYNKTKFFFFKFSFLFAAVSFTRFGNYVHSMYSIFTFRLPKNNKIAITVDIWYRCTVDEYRIFSVHAFITIILMNS